MVYLTMTPAILQALDILSAHGQAEIAAGNATEPSLDQPVEGDPISHGQLIEISKKLKKVREEAEDREARDDNVVCHLDDLLRGSRIYVEPPKPKVEPTSEYKALMARLRREEEDRIYERMISPPLPTETFTQRFPNSAHNNLFNTSQTDAVEDDEISYADINRQMALIINILISIVACSVALWLAARHWSTPSRLGLSMGGSGMIGIAEVVIYAGYLRRLKEAREKGKKEVELKEIVKTWVIGGDERISTMDKSRLIESKQSHGESIRMRRARPK